MATDNRSGSETLNHHPAGYPPSERALYHIPYELNHPDGVTYERHSYYEVEEGSFAGDGVLLLRSDEGHYSLASASLFPCPRERYEVLGRLVRVMKPRRCRSDR